MANDLLQPVVNPSRCIGCGDCVAACPVQALAKGPGVAIVANADACNYCGLCEDVCSRYAIELPYLVLFEEHEWAT